MGLSCNQALPHLAVPMPFWGASVSSSIKWVAWERTIANFLPGFHARIWIHMHTC